MKKILFLLSLILTSCSSIKNAMSPVNSDKLQRTDVIKVEQGLIQGVVNNTGDVEIFAGIPFAKPPAGELRWKEPQNLDPWNGILLADYFAPMSMQTQNSALYNKLLTMYTNSETSRTYGAPMSEDCLYLNIWRPKSTEEASSSNTTVNHFDKKRPVLVYIHGGSLMGGQSWYETYDGENLAKHGIIVVTIAYRTGIFGYFADKELAEESPNHTTGNYGLLDQIKALEWVHKNIESFGGDANNVTIAGESAGSSSVNALCASPLTQGYFRRAIGESSSVIQKTPPHTFSTMENALKMGDDIKKEFKVTSAGELRKVPAEKLIKTKYANNSMTVDGYALPQTPYEIYAAGKNHEEALLNGFNDKEGNAFTFFTRMTKDKLTYYLREAMKGGTEDFIEKQNIKTNKDAKRVYNDVFSAVCFTYPHNQWTKAVTKQGRPVYEYYFSKTNSEISTNHSGEIVYAYRNVPRTKNYNESDYELEKIMSSYWLNFIKTGNPNGLRTDGKQLPVWQTSAESDGLLLELGENCIMREDPFSYIYEYLEE